jgi:pimeloyl-ACP methyl ester carboxylesterase
VASIVLVHGAWQGAWCWDRLVPLLDAAGHTATAVELTGCGSRAPMTVAIDLATHVADVVGAVEAVDDERVVLVVHSYSGMVAAGAAEVVAPRLAAVVLVDAFYPSHGESALDQMPAAFAERFRAQAAGVGDGWRLPAGDALLDVWGLHDPEDRRWVRDNLTDWSLRCFESPVAMPTGAVRQLPRWFVGGAGDHPAGPAFAAIGERAAADGCALVTLPCGHDVQVERPAELAGVIDDAAAAA